MSYESSRDSDQLDIMGHAIEDFIDRFNQSTVPATKVRQVVFLFPGGMASRLKQATKPYNCLIGGTQSFQYVTAWATPLTLVGGALSLRMKKRPQGKYRDHLHRIVIADGEVSFLGVKPYRDFTDWCEKEQLDYFVYGWDWRRRIDECARFFLEQFLPHFQECVKAGCNNFDPLENYTVIGHSAGGMLANWVLRQGPAGLARAITVATPFYGYAGQTHRWFEGESYLNGPGNVMRDDIIRVICSLPGCYAWQFMDEGMWMDAMALLKADLSYPLADYPSLDATTSAIADPYHPTTSGSSSRYPPSTSTGFDPAELATALDLIRYLASDLCPDLASKFYNIRGDDPATDTAGTVTWDYWDPQHPFPYVDKLKVAGDGVIPAWSARHARLETWAGTGHVVHVKGADVEHQCALSAASTQHELAKILGV